MAGAQRSQSPVDAVMRGDGISMKPALDSPLFDFAHIPKESAAPLAN
jgi:hypothetical protein